MFLKTKTEEKRIWLLFLLSLWNRKFKEGVKAKNGTEFSSSNIIDRIVL